MGCFIFIMKPNGAVIEHGADKVAMRNGIAGMNRVASAPSSPDIHLGAHTHGAILHQGVGALAAMYYGARPDHARQQRLAHRHRSVFQTSLPLPSAGAS